MNLMGKYYAGIDGGGTKTRTIISDGAGLILGEAIAGPSSIHHNQFDSALRNITISLEQAILNSGLEKGDIVDAVIGVAGLDNKSKYTDFKKILEEHSFPIKNVQILPDSLLACYGAFGNDHGLIVIGGTGYIVLGSTGNNMKLIREHTYEGGKMGWEQDTLPCGRSISYSAAKTIQRLSRNDHSSPFVNTFRENFDKGNIFNQYQEKDDSFEDVIDNLISFREENSGCISDDDASSLAKVVIELAQNDDDDAAAILDWAGINVGYDIAIIAENLGLYHTTFPICLIGTVITQPIMKERVEQNVFPYESKAIFTKPIQNPAEAGAEIAKKGITYDLQLYWDADMNAPIELKTELPFF